MAFNLLNERFLPILRANGTKERIAPWQITDHYADNPVVALDAPRPDFNGGALLQFLVGLLQTAFAPKNDGEWAARLFGEPPSPKELQAAFARYENAFNLDGDGPRFMQDLDPLAAQKPLPITALLIDTAGSETHFIKNLPEQGFSPAMAAMALYALQTNAPAGGAGHRTSLRGGGPLTTLVVCAPDDPKQPPTLWQTLWLNVLEASHFKSKHNHDLPEDIFPWLAETRTSEKNSKTEFTTRENVNPLQMFWGMPRRIRLDFENVGSGECGLSGEHADILVRQYRTKNYGVNYSGAWEHVLSPHNRSEAETLPVHAKGQINYRHWLGLVQTNQDKKIQRVPAATVQRFWKERLHREGFRFRLWAFGYDMDNMKPRCWYEATLPLFKVEEAQRESFEATVKNLIDAAGYFLGNLRSCLKDAWFSDGDPRRAGADTGFLDAAFWSDTESEFYDLLERLRSTPSNNDLRKKTLLDWHGILNSYTLKTFDRYANTSQINEQNPRRIAEAQRNLMRFNYKKDIKDALDMPITTKKKA